MARVKKNIARSVVDKLAKSNTIKIGFSDLDMWADSGNHAINYYNSGDFNKAFLFGRNYIIYGESGCHPAGTLVYGDSGNLVRVEKVRVGDRIMSPSGGFNTVLKKIKGYPTNHKMYMISPTSRADDIMPYTVNDDHVLVLAEETGDVSSPVKTHNVKMKDYLSDKAKYGHMKMIRYFGVTTSEDAVDDDQAYQKGAKIKHITSSPPLWPYISSTYKTRHQWAKGILSNYPMNMGKHTIEFDETTYVRDWVNLFRFCGYSVNQKDYTSLEVMDSTFGRYGYELYDFEVTDVAPCFYYGFELDGDQRYFLEDFTVTHNSAKSLLCATTAANAQKEHGALVVWMDVERATDDKAGMEWFEHAGMDMSEDSFLYMTISQLEEIKSVITKICKEYREEVMNGTDPKDLQPIVFVVDSWAVALTSSQWEKVGGKEAGAIVGDMGQKAKQTGDVISALTHVCGGIPVLVLGVQHIMDNQDGYGRKYKTTGGHKLIFLASGAMLLTKKEMRLEDVDNPEVAGYYEELYGGMTADVKKKLGGSKRVVGIVSKAEVLKSRTSKPFSSVDIQIPQQTGIDKYSGLFDVLMMEGYITSPSSGWYQYEPVGGEPVKFRKKDFRSDHADVLMEMVSNKTVKKHNNEDDNVVAEPEIVDGE